MKVLMIEPLGSSGICYYTASLCRALRPMVDDLVLLTSRNYELDANKEPYTVLPMLGGMNRRQSKLRRFIDSIYNPLITLEVIRHFQPTIIHFQDSFIPLIELWSVGIAHAKAHVCYTIHDVDPATILLSKPTILSRLNTLARGLIYHKADSLITLSKNSTDELQQRFKVAPARIHQLLIGIQDAQIVEPLPDRSEARERLNLTNDRIVALFFGSLKRLKGLDHLLKALQLVIKHLPNFLLVVAGSPRSENKTDYVNMARMLGVSDFVRFDLRYIPLDEVAYYFIACDFVVLPYQRVYQSAVLATAYTFGRPVIATKVGGLAEMVEDGKSGYLVDDPSNIYLLADKIISMGVDKTNRQSMEQYVRHLGNTVYSWDAIAKETRRIYNAIIS